MIKGLYAAASAMLAGITEQNILSHNISNMDTPGFKQILTSLQDFLQTPVSAPPATAAGIYGSRWIGEIGLGTDTTGEEIDFTQGTLQLTSQPMDFAIEGNGFFRVQTPNGERYTRDGRFYLDSEGQMVTVDGYFVLDEGGQPITLPENGDLSVNAEGRIFMNGEEVAQFGRAAFLDPAAELTRQESNVFLASGDPSSEDYGVIVQGYIEASNSNAAQLNTQMVIVARHYEAAQQLVQNQDALLGQAITALGRIS